MENNQNKIDLRQFTRKEILDLKGLIYDGKLPLSEQDQHFVNALRGSLASYKDIPKNILENVLNSLDLENKTLGEIIEENTDKNIVELQRKAKEYFKM